jgi:hypothetical protein
MMAAVRSCWALFLGIALMMLGNGLQGSLLAIRASLEGFPTTVTGTLMSGYFAGFLIGVRASAHHESPGILRLLGSFGFCRAGSFRCPDAPLPTCRAPISIWEFYPISAGLTTAT